MYRANGTYYTEEHSVSFGDLVTRTSGGYTYTEFSKVANTWTDWYLIPSSRLSVAHPTIVTKFIEVPGSDGMLDLTTYLTGRPVYGQRQGSFSFNVDNGHMYWEILRAKIANTLHGKKMKMVLLDDPNYYYEGRFTVGNWTSGGSNSTIDISYQLDPYKIKINKEGSDHPMLWDPFNFDADYDYMLLTPNITVSNQTKTFYIYANEYPFAPIVTRVSGTVSATFGGVTKTVSSSSPTQTLGRASNGRNVLTVTGTGSIKIEWRGGSL